MSRVVKAFCGLTDNSPLAVNIKFKSHRIKIFVAFGEIIIPRPPKPLSELEKIEQEFECKVRVTGFVTKVVPNVVEEIVKKDGVLCSAVDEHVNALRNWFEKHGLRVIGTLLFGCS